MEAEVYERHDALHEEMMAAYEAAEELLVQCQETGDPDDVRRYQSELRRAFRLSNEVHLEADTIMLIHYERRRLRYGA